ncbi:hypothetical protein EB796_003119 [Bugula neritina]|uniref:Guanylate-binding protein N-terminal domain-containing protein n=1 Tax=Bugula neritina TaxID=10212 RepID=A0A7J7KKV1_BUGNE|nr:hypothetical protein EB796_003119 [Bugula neritina]
MLDQPIIFTRKNKEKIAIVIIDIQGLGDSDNSDEAVDNLLMYVELQMCNVQIINMNRKFNSFHFVKVASCATYSEMNDKVPSAFGTLVLMARDFTLEEESKLGLQYRQFSAMGLKKRIAAHTDGLPNTEHDIMDVSINKILITSQKHYEELMAEKVCALL